MEIYEPVTALSALQNNWSQRYCKFPNKFVRAMKFFFKELFFSSKTFHEITLSRVFFNTFFRINPRKVLWIYFEKGTLKRTQDGLVLSWVNSEKGTLKSTRTAQKVSKYGVLSGYYFINLRIQSEYKKIWARNNSLFGHFSP